MAWRRPGDKPLSEAMMFDLPDAYMRYSPQWVNEFKQMSLYLMQHNHICRIYNTEYEYYTLRCNMLQCFEYSI